MSNLTKEIFLLERTKNSSSTIIGFYSSEENAIQAVRRHIQASITHDIEESRTKEKGQVPIGAHLIISIREAFLITRNEVEIDKGAEFAKIEDPDQFPQAIPLGNAFHVAEDLGDIKDPVIDPDNRGISECAYYEHMQGDIELNETTYSRP